MISVSSPPTTSAAGKFLVYSTTLSPLSPLFMATLCPGTPAFSSCIQALLRPPRLLSAPMRGEVHSASAEAAGTREEPETRKMASRKKEEEGEEEVERLLAEKESI